MATDHREMIEFDTFEHGHAFSYTQQRYLESLLTEVRSTDTPLTIVVGAGVSINAGLPSWRQLIEGMAEQIQDERLKVMAKQDGSDPLRKAELILQLVKKGQSKPKPDLSNDPRIQDERIIRRALYVKGYASRPGQLAEAIARLVAARRESSSPKAKDVRILTTNFDTVLETALSRYFDSGRIRSFSLDQVAEWKDWADRDEKNIGILHVHGVVRPAQNQRKPQGPVVLTESQFFKHGAHVREQIFECLKDSCSIFVGLSMSDPNLVGPVYDMYNNNVPRKPYVVVVPEDTAGAENSMESARYSIEAGHAMEREMGLRSIFLKSYSQLNQLLSDLSLAIMEPKRYRPLIKGAPARLVYGNRLMRALDDIYGKIGCSRDGEIPLDDAARELSDTLYASLHGPDGPVAHLQACATSIGHPSIDESGESFALFLWLRCRSRNGANAPYSLQLVGSSAYSHREPWSWPDPQLITRDSTISAVNAVFFGSHLSANLSPRTLPVWRGILACPIVVSEWGSNYRIRGVALDQLTVGAITLNSTHFADKSQEERDRQASTLSRVESFDKMLSVTTKLDDAQLNELWSRIETAAAKVVG